MTSRVTISAINANVEVTESSDEENFYREYLVQDGASLTLHVWGDHDITIHETKLTLVLKDSSGQ